jgi:hypothetical protein
MPSAPDETAFAWRTRPDASNRAFNNPIIWSSMLSISRLTLSRSDGWLPGCSMRAAFHYPAIRCRKPPLIHSSDF